MTSRAREIRCRIGQKGDLEPKLEKRVLKTRFLTLDPPSLIRGGARGTDQAMAAPWINQWINLSMDRSINGSINQWINLSMD
jgi:hypothetical protein